MAAHHRYHVDQDGHSITVLSDVRRRRADVLVDGKTVASVRVPRHGAAVLRGELPGDLPDPPKPFLIRVSHAYDAGDVPPCALETDGMRYLMPSVPLTRQEERPAEPTPPARTPGELLRRWKNRIDRAVRREH
ncbi:hypothetical protein ACFWP3_27700 [Streptomyces sp. NPDC058525]|uniref:hypothetical protein n=1 Tax=Streptomyces sp. NPDC058525 TaxID=3346538 RepID=UPI003651B618